MTIRIASAVAAVVLSFGTPTAFAQSYTAPAGISAAAAPGGSRTTRSYDDLTTGSLGANRGGQLSVHLPELSTDDDSATAPASHHRSASGDFFAD